MERGVLYPELVLQLLDVGTGVTKTTTKNKKQKKINKKNKKNCLF
jgi:hypothetical protein